jgi:hypothetical protein
MQHRGEMISLIVATLDGGERVKAVAHVNTESKLTSLQIGDDLPQFLSMPGPAEFKQLLSPSP